MLHRDLGDGTGELVTTSRWTSLDAVQGFAGEDVGVARFSPEDRFLIGREPFVLPDAVVG